MKNHFSKDNRLVYSSVITSPLPYKLRDVVSQLCLRRMAEMCIGRYCYRSAHLAQECRGILDSIYEFLFLLLQVPFAALSIVEIPVSLANGFSRSSYGRTHNSPLVAEPPQVVSPIRCECHYMLTSDSGFSNCQGSRAISALLIRRG